MAVAAAAVVAVRRSFAGRIRGKREAGRRDTKHLQLAARRLATATRRLLESHVSSPEDNVVGCRGSNIITN